MLIDLANEQSECARVAVLIINDRVNSQLVSGFNAGVKIIRINRKEGSRNNLHHILKIWRILFQLKPDAIHCHNHALIKLLPFWRKKTAITIHDIGIPTRNVH